MHREADAAVGCVACRRDAQPVARAHAGRVRATEDPDRPVRDRLTMAAEKIVEGGERDIDGLE